MRQPNTSTDDVRDVPMDRVTGVPDRRSTVGRNVEGADSAYIEQEIRRTRARMGETLDQIEERLSPARLKREFKHSVAEKLADVREEYNPKRIAKRAGDTMLDTLKDHPIAAVTAGLSVGYLAMKGAEDSGARRSHDRTPRGGTYYDGSYGASVAYPREQGHAEASGSDADRFRTPETRVYGADRSRDKDRSDEIRDRAGAAQGRMREEVEDVKQRAEDLVQDSADRAVEFKDSAVRRSRSVARWAGREARSAGSQFEDFIYDNPLAAGAIAVGIGAFIGGLFPSSSIEDMYMGSARDEAVDRARRIADETIDHGKEAARRVADDAKEAAKDVAEKGKQEAKNVGGTAQRTASAEAKDVKSSQRTSTAEANDDRGSARRIDQSDAIDFRDSEQRGAAEGTRDLRGTVGRGGADENRDMPTKNRSFGSPEK